MIYDILVVEDDFVFNQLVVEHLNRIGYRAHDVASWKEAQAYLAENEPDLIIMDKRLPDTDAIDVLQDLVPQFPVIILTAFGSVQSAVEAMQKGASDYLSKPVNLDELELVLGRVLHSVHTLRDLKFNRDRSETGGKNAMVGSSAALTKVHKYIGAVAREDLTVLILGESGVGKELVASSIHRQSQRAERNFVCVDCCSFNEQLFESELFGHEKGAFTGADRQKTGLIEGAKGGTLFLDEIGEIQPSIQAKLLHVLETGIYRRVGGTKDLQANVRIVAATNKDLGELSAAGQFRSDLFYRLNRFVINVPPLRDRKEDIPALIDHFLQHHSFSSRGNISASDEALEKLVEYNWPGNVRELKNIVERGIILMGDVATLHPSHVTFINHRDNGISQLSTEPTIKFVFDHEPTLEEIESKYIRMLLNKHKGRRVEVAEILGMSERTLYRFLRKQKSNG